MDEFLALRVHPEPVGRLSADPLAFAAQVLLRMSHARTKVFRLRSRQFRERRDNCAGGVVRGVEPFHDGHETTPHRLNAVENPAHLTNAFTGEAVQLPDDQRADDSGGDGRERGIESLALNRFVAGAPPVRMGLANGESVAFGPCTAVGFLPFDCGLAVTVERQTQIQITECFLMHDSRVSGISVLRR